MMSDDEKEQAIDRLYQEILPIVEQCTNREEFAEMMVGLSIQSQKDWNLLDALDKKIFLHIVKNLMDVRYEQPNS